MYELQTHQFTTPNGNPVVVNIRQNCNDWNTAFASLNEDEYGLRGMALSGLCLDVGGYLGTVALALALDFPDTRVIVVEPVPENLVLIRRNLIENDVEDQVTVVRGIAGPPGGGVIRYAFQGGENELHHAFVGNAHWATGETPHTALQVPSHSLSDLIGDETVALLKIDCEGGEYAFLDDPAVAQVQRIVGEWHPNRPEGGSASREDITALLGATHDVTFTGPEGGPGGFVAVRK